MCVCVCVCDREHGFNFLFYVQSRLIFRWFIVWNEAILKVCVCVLVSIIKSINDLKKADKLYCDRYRVRTRQRSLLSFGWLIIVIFNNWTKGRLLEIRDLNNYIDWPRGEWIHCVSQSDLKFHFLPQLKNQNPRSIFKWKPSRLFYIEVFVRFT